MVLYDFYADWCGMCKAALPIITDFSKKHPEIKLVKINVDEPENEDLITKYSITHLPTLVFTDDDGTVLYKCSRGVNPKDLEDIYLKIHKKDAKIHTNPTDL